MFAYCTAAMNKQIKGVRTNSVGYLVDQMSGRMDAAMSVELKPLGLDIRFFANLISLLIEDELSQAELGQRVGEAEYTTSRVIDALEERGLVERRKDPNSRRAHRIALTDKGRAQAKQLPPIVRRVNRTVLKRLDKDEQQELVRLLGKALGVDEFSQHE